MKIKHRFTKIIECISFKLLFIIITSLFTCFISCSSKINSGNSIDKIQSINDAQSFFNRLYPEDSNFVVLDLRDNITDTLAPCANSTLGSLDIVNGYHIADFDKNGLNDLLLTGFDTLSRWEGKLQEDWSMSKEKYTQYILPQISVLLSHPKDSFSREYIYSGPFERYHYQNDGDYCAYPIVENEINIKLISPRNEFNLHNRTITFKNIGFVEYNPSPIDRKIESVKLVRDPLGGSPGYTIELKENGLVMMNLTWLGRVDLTELNEKERNEKLGLYNANITDSLWNKIKDYFNYIDISNIGKNDFLNFDRHLHEGGKTYFIYFEDEKEMIFKDDSDFSTYGLATLDYWFYQIEETLVWEKVK